MKFIAVIFVTLLAIVTSKAQTCTPIQGCDVTIGESCYAHVDDILNWNQAEECCVAWGGHLASIHSNDTNNVLNNIRNQDRWTWIGLSDTANDGVYVWTDGTLYDYENFAPDQPSNGKFNGESCFHFFDTSYGALTWNDYGCNRFAYRSNRYRTIVTSYICQKMISEALSCTPIQGCDVTIGESCYAHVDDSLNWNQAEECCVAWGGHLASIHSSDVNTVLNSIRNQDRWTWIGLSDTANDGVYVWTDGTPFDYENFAVGEQNGPGGESCFHLYDTSIYDRALTWSDYLCNNSTYKSILTSYICQTLTSEAQICTPIQECDVTIGESAYAHVDDSLNWNQAEDCCVAWGGHLASIHSSDVNNILNSIRNQDRWTWIGLSDTANDSVYVWTDGTPFDYENFAVGQPNGPLGESCFHLFSIAEGALTWNDYLCNNSTFITILTSYICQKRVTSLATNPPLSLSYDNSANQLSIDWILNPSQPITVTYRLELVYELVYTRYNRTYPYNATYTFSQTSTDTDYSRALTDVDNDVDRIDITALLSITEQCDAPYSGVKITAVYSIEFIYITATTATTLFTSVVVIIFIIIIILVILSVSLSVITALVIALVSDRMKQQLTHIATPTAATHRCEYIDMD